MQTRTQSIFGVVVLLSALVLVRVFERYIFDTTLIDYFNGAYEFHPIPEVKILPLFLSLSLRFLINTILSIGIIYLIYRKRLFVNASLWIYLISYILLSVAFLFLIHGDGDFVKRALFYVRRFLIHPLLLFVLVAGFYFLKQRKITLQ